MKKSIKIVPNKILAGLLILLLYSCQDKKWDDYYSKPDYLEEGSIMHILSGTSDYKEFSGLIRKTGYDSLLSRNEMFTVFALKNGSFSSIDTTSDLVGLKKIMGMHILPMVVFKDRMSNNNYLSLTGKALKFSETPEGETVNKITFSLFDKRVLNGVIHEVKSVIIPLPSLYELVVTDPDFSSLKLKSYIDSSYTRIVDTQNNKTIGFDTLGLPIYRTPIIYKQSSDYMSLVKIDNEMVLSTLFLPKESAMNSCFSKMLAAREGNRNLITPRLNKMHGDTTVGNYFIPANTAYKGDSAVLKDYLLNNNVLRGEVSAFGGGINSFTNVSGNKFVVNQNQIISGSTKKASNGYIYSLSDFTLPDFVYRKTFIFFLSPKIPNPANPLQMIDNPGIVYRNGPNPAPVTNYDYTNLFRFSRIDAELDIIMPYVTKGKYKVTISPLWYRGSRAYEGNRSDGGTFRRILRNNEVIKVSI
jgi:uncharacterized surface protein with fasciclin (FAS1) repeats